MAVKLLGDLSASGNATFNSEVNLPSGGQIDWANGDARIEEGLVTNYSLSFQTWTGSALTTKMFIQSGGNVGIGTTSPTTKLEVGGFSTNTSSIKAGSLEIQSYAINNGWFAENLYYNGSAGGWTLRNAGYATKIYMQDGAIEFKRAASGAAGSTASITSTMRLLNNGNVGIGTTAPLEKLHVVGKINSSNNIVSNSTYTMFTGRSNRTTDDYGGLNKEYFKANLVTAGPNTTGEASAHGIADLRFQLANSPGNTNMSDIMTLRSGGNVGIGTTTPDSTLQIVGNNSTAGTLTLNDANKGDQRSHIHYGSNGDWYIRSAAVAGKIILQDNGGNVGIGTTSPSEKLHVVGNGVFHSGANLGRIKVGRSANQEIEIYVDDTNNIITAYQDSDGNSSHVFALDREFDGTGANYFEIRKGGSAQMHIDTSGNVGIGTTTFPTTAIGDRELLVQGAIASKPAGVDDYYSYLKSNWSDDGAFELGIQGADTNHKLITTSNYYYGTQLNFHTSDQKRMVIDTNGNVGIGTTSPDTKLEVNGQASFGNNSTLAIQNDAFVTVRATAFAGIDVKSLRKSGNIGGLRAYDSNGTVQGQLLLKVDGGFEFYNSDSRLYITSGGNVGIGTTSPSVKLHVDSGGIRATGTTSTTGQIDASPNFGAFRFYDGSTFYGGLGMGQWAGAGANTDIVQYLSANVNYHVSNTTTPVLTVSSAGNVGIGTTSPNRKLTIQNGSYTYPGGIDANSFFAIANDGWAGMNILSSRGTGGFIDFGDLDWGHRGRILYGQSTDYMSFDTAGSTKMTILSGGNVGIGTTSPEGKLNIVADNGSTASAVKTLVLGGGTDTTGNGQYIQFRSSSNATLGSQISGSRTGAGAASDLKFHTTGSDSVVRERMVINSSGNVGIGTTSPSTKLDVDGVITATSGNSTNWNTAYGWGNHGSAGYLTTSSAASTYAPLASPALTGTPTAPTAAAATNTTQLATTAFVSTAIANLADSAPATLDTLNELAAALGDDANFSTTVTNSIATKLPLAGGNLTGNLGINSSTPAAPLDVQPNSSYKVTKVGDDRTSHYKFTDSADNTLTLASGSYHSAEVVITAHQTNGGTNNNLYIRGIWTNNHTTHHWHEIENIGGLSGSSFTITNGQSGDTTNSGELEIFHDYTSGSFAQMVVRVTDHYGTHSYTIS